jgi:hypothetical protein
MRNLIGQKALPQRESKGWKEMGKGWKALVMTVWS